MPVTILGAVFRDFASFWRYVAIGVLNNGGAYVFGLILLALGLRAWQATAIMYPLATAVSFYGNRKWSFATRATDRAQFSKYICVYAIAYPAAVGLTWSQERHGVPAWLATLVTMSIAVIAIYMALSYWVFRSRKPRHP